jgi:hypothetical protein
VSGKQCAWLIPNSYNRLDVFSTALASAADYFYVLNTTPRPVLYAHTRHYALSTTVLSPPQCRLQTTRTFACNANTYNEWRATLITFLYSKDLEGYLQKDKTKRSARTASTATLTCTGHVPAPLGPVYQQAASPNSTLHLSALAASCKLVLFDCQLAPGRSFSSPVSRTGAGI